MINFDDEVTSKSRPYILVHLYRTLIMEGSRIGKTNALLNLIFHPIYIDKIDLYVKNPYESNITFQSKNAKMQEQNVIKKPPKPFMEYSKTVHNIYNNINDCNPNRSRKILIVFDDMIANMNIDKKFIP